MNFLASKAQLRASFLRWALFLVPLIVLLGFTAGQLGSPQTAWFQNLQKPAVFPPPAVFGIVWGAMYVLIGLALALVVSAWGAYGRAFAIGIFAVHFIGNLSWTAVFFGMQDMTAALYVLGYAVVTLIAVFAVFWRVRRLAALMLIPYFAWASFATVLNYQFIELNPDGGVSGDNGAVERVTL